MEGWWEYKMKWAGGKIGDIWYHFSFLKSENKNMGIKVLVCTYSLFTMNFAYPSLIFKDNAFCFTWIVKMKDRCCFFFNGNWTCGLCNSNHIALGLMSPILLLLWCSGQDSTFQCRRCKRCGFDIWVGKITWRRKWQPNPVFLSGKFPGYRSLAGYSPWSLKELDMAAHTHTCSVEK